VISYFQGEICMMEFYASINRFPCQVLYFHERVYGVKRRIKFFMYEFARFYTGVHKHYKNNAGVYRGGEMESSSQFYRVGIEKRGR